MVWMPTGANPAAGQSLSESRAESAKSNLQVFRSHGFVAGDREVVLRHRLREAIGNGAAWTSGDSEYITLSVGVSGCAFAAVVAADQSGHTEREVMVYDATQRLQHFRLSTQIMYSSNGGGGGTSGSLRGFSDKNNKDNNSKTKHERSRDQYHGEWGAAVSQRIGSVAVIPPLPVHGLVASSISSPSLSKDDDFWLAVAPLLLLYSAQLPKETTLMLASAPLGKPSASLVAAMNRLGLASERWVTGIGDTGKAAFGSSFPSPFVTYGEELFTFFGPASPRQQRLLGLSQAWRVVKALRSVAPPPSSSPSKRSSVVLVCGKKSAPNLSGSCGAQVKALKSLLVDSGRMSSPSSSSSLSPLALVSAVEVYPCDSLRLVDDAAAIAMFRRASLVVVAPKWLDGKAEEEEKEEDSDGGVCEGALMAFHGQSDHPAIAPCTDANGILDQDCVQSSISQALTSSSSSWLSSSSSSSYSEPPTAVVYAHRSGSSSDTPPMRMRALAAAGLDIWPAAAPASLASLSSKEKEQQERAAVLAAVKAALLSRDAAERAAVDAARASSYQLRGGGSSRKPIRESSEWKVKWASTVDNDDGKDDESETSRRGARAPPVPPVPGLTPVETSLGDVADRDQFGAFLEGFTSSWKGGGEEEEKEQVIGVEVGVEYGDFANVVRDYCDSRNYRPLVGEVVEREIEKATERNPECFL